MTTKYYIVHIEDMHHFILKYISLLPLFFSPLAKQMASSKLYTQGEMFLKGCKKTRPFSQIW
jgi:hypothetical protein